MVKCQVWHNYCIQIKFHVSVPKLVKLMSFHRVIILLVQDLHLVATYVKTTHLHK